VAAKYNIAISLPKGWEGHDNQTTELVLAIDYLCRRCSAGVF
jgi:hypothetical protein